jgi:hypothetical protein
VIEQQEAINQATKQKQIENLKSLIEE